MTEVPVSWVRSRLERLGIVDSLWALIGGGVATLMVLIVVTVVGSVSGYSAIQLLEGTLPSIRFLCSTVATGGVTILALMVTLLGLSQSVDTELDIVHCRRIQAVRRVIRWHDRGRMKDLLTEAQAASCGSTVPWSPT